MQLFTIALFGALFVPTVLGFLTRRILNDPVSNYISRVCYPLYSNGTRQSDLRLSANSVIPSLANSPFPCEQQLYLEQICMANGTTEVDFLAEQQCLCGSPVFEIFNACAACYFAHGYVANVSPEEATSQVASLQTAECSPSPPYQPFSNLLTVPNITSLRLSPSLTLGNDRFPNMTAVSNYATVTRSATPGSITGSATGRLTSWTNYSGIKYTPTSIPSQFATTSSARTSSTGTGTAGGAGAGSSSTSSAATSSTTTKANTGSRGEAQAAGGILAAALAAVFVVL